MKNDFIFGFVLLLTGFAQADQPPAVTAALQSTLRVEKKDGTLCSSALLVSEDGYALTKASEVRKTEDHRFVLPDGSLTPVREVERDSQLDLLLLRCEKTTGLKAAHLEESKSLSMGQWLLSPRDGGREIRAGVVSAKRRSIPSAGSAIGIQMDLGKLDKGVRIKAIIPDSPAEDAGLQANDVVLSIAGEPIDKNQGVRDLIGRRSPGDEVEILYRRAGKESKCLVRVASRAHIESYLSDDDYANGGVSLRADRFHDVLQHDVPLGPADMGSGLMNLQGQAIGINIARADRVTTFALPTEAFWPQVKKWIEKDRAAR